MGLSVASLAAIDMEEMAASGVDRRSHEDSGRTFAVKDLEGALAWVRALMPAGREDCCGSPCSAVAVRQ